MKLDPPVWMLTNFERMNVLVESNNNIFMDKLFVNKPVAIGYNVVRNPVYENLNLEKHAITKYFGEDSVEWFINKRLEKAGYKINILKMRSKLILIEFRKFLIKIFVGYVKRIQT